MGKQWKQCQTLFFWAPKSLQMVTAAMKSKDTYSLEEKLWPIERVTGRKVRGLQTEEIACKCQTFLSLLSTRRKQTSDVFSFSIQIWKEVSLQILCCHNDTWFHLKLTVLKPRDNQCLFLMGMFVLSYANALCIYPKLSSSRFRLLAQNLLDKPVCYMQILFP